jgi:hypothetical protein
VWDEQNLVEQFFIKVDSLDMKNWWYLVTSFRSIITDVMRKYTTHRIVRLAIEDVELWGNNARSQTSAKNGDTFWLAKLIGAYTTEFIHRSEFLKKNCPININSSPDDYIRWIRVQDWKGNLPNDIVEKRVIKWLAEHQQKFLTLSNEHLYCAFGVSYCAITGKMI